MPNANTQSIECVTNGDKTYVLDIEYMEIRKNFHLQQSWGEEYTYKVEGLYSTNHYFMHTRIFKLF